MGGDLQSRTAVTRSPEETVALGYELAKELKPPVLVLLLGDLGAGKTTLAKGLVAGLGAAPEEEVTSPTFTMIHEYGFTPSAALPSASLPSTALGTSGASGTGRNDAALRQIRDREQSRTARVYHVDLYRVETARELETLGLEDLLAEDAVVIVEWGEKLGSALRASSPGSPGGVIEIRLETKGEEERQIVIQQRTKSRTDRGDS